MLGLSKLASAVWGKRVDGSDTVVGSIAVAANDRQPGLLHKAMKQVVNVMVRGYAASSTFTLVGTP